MEVTSAQAAEILGVSRVTVWSHVEDGRLKAERVGLRRDIVIQLDDLRDFAAQYNYRVDEDAVERISRQ